MTFEELKERQGWSLQQKIDHSLGAIDQFISRLDGRVYVSFSGGKDSTVLLDLCRIIKPDIKAVFCNTGNEFPDIVRFVRELKNTEGYNIEIIHPELKPKEVLANYGFPLVSKEVSEKIWYARNRPESIRAKIALGEYESKWYTIPKKWSPLIYETFGISNICCKKLKKEPFAKYQKTNKVWPIIGTMACESSLRKTAYVKRGGCNVFRTDGKSRSQPSSLPLSIWVEDDIWSYIHDRGLKIADIYYKGAKRTGCMFCGFGAQFKDDSRLQRLYELYPRVYETMMNYTNNGVTYREALRKMLAVNGLYLPDEKNIMPNDSIGL